MGAAAAARWAAAGRPGGHCVAALVAAALAVVRGSTERGRLKAHGAVRRAEFASAQSRPAGERGTASAPH
eukprot:4439446-Lingulodinium_polyedra.AAC.1